MSLSRLLQKQTEVRIPVDSKEASQTVEDDIMEKLVNTLLESKLAGLEEPPKLVRTSLYDYEKPEVKDKERNFLFIADCQINKHIKQQLSGQDIRIFDANFINRDTEALYEAGIEHIWLNICDKQARQWLELNLKPNVIYTSCLVWSKNKLNKFLRDLRPHVDIESKVSGLSKISALSLDEMMNKLENKIDIHSPASCLAGLFSCGGSIVKKKA